MIARTSALSILIEDFIPADADHRRMFAELNREWLTEYGFLEPADEAMFADPEGLILARDGRIVFARARGHFVGTGTLLQCEEGVYEIGKMAVTSALRGNGIGRHIAEELIATARRKGAHTLYIASNRMLERAIALYRNLGFVEMPTSADTRYASCDITMTLRLNDC